MQRLDSPDDETALELLSTQGWALLRGVYESHQLACLADSLSELESSQDEAVRMSHGSVYASRNVLELCPQIAHQWGHPRLKEFVRQVLGQQAGLVRALFFDKPPGRTWALPWHKDLQIAVRAGDAPPGYSRPRLRAGVWHTEPPPEVLERMLTLRVHLDPMVSLNGPLKVLSGSHRTGKQLVISGFENVVIESQAGDVLAMRPLLVHASGSSGPDCELSRRVLHLEFSGMPDLPGGVQWQTFLPVSS